MERGIIRCFLQSGLELGDGGVEIRSLEKSDAEVALVAGVSGSQTQRGLEFGDGAGRVAELKQRQAEIVAPFRILRLEFRDLPESCDRFLDVSGALLEQTQPGLSVNEIGLQFDAGAVFADGGVDVSFMFERLPEIEKSLRVFV